MQINKNSNVINFKQCPTCKVIIEKNDGCNHMKCINCDYEFCWLCMKQYLADHYAIYNFTGCPGMRYSKKI
jgi:ariadne-1